MKNKIAVLLVICISYFNISAQTNWKLEKDKDGIKIWNRKLPNSGLKEYKGITVIQTTVDKLVSFFKNFKIFFHF